MDGAERIISVEPSLLSPLLNNETGLFIIEIKEKPNVLNSSKTTTQGLGSILPLQ